MRYYVGIFIITLLLVSPFSVTLAQNSTPDFTSPCQTGQSKEECAVENLNQGMLPEVVADETEDPLIASWLTGIGQKISGLLSFFTGANNLQDAYLPDLERSNENPDDSLSNTLAGPEGYYGATLPEKLPEDYSRPSSDGLQIGPVKIPNFFSTVTPEEKFYEQSYFPEEYCDENGQCEKICPITGQCNN